MYYAIGAGNLYRVTMMDVPWPNPVRGHGAFYVPKEGNRFNGPDQLTVYCTEDPVVALTEGAYYQALKWQNAIAYSRMHGVSYPLRSEHLFSAFRIDPIPSVIDLEDPRARPLFSYSPQLLLNPNRDYIGTQGVANDVRLYIPPPGAPEPRPEGLKAPSVRTPRVGAFQPHQLALFVRDMVNVLPYDQRSHLVAKMRVEFEFLATTPVAGPAGYHSVVINWSRPRFRITRIPGEPSLSPVPEWIGRPGGKPIRLNRWYTSGLPICF